MRLIKALRHLQPNEILLLFSLYSSESYFYQRIKVLKNSIGIPHVLKLDIDEIVSLISSSLIPWLISHSCCLGLPKFLSA
jgi:hypothetical protein